ncbi:MAG: hypothetical protein Q7R63_00100 [bacterium]|nr:hypothetical protein [bacterium]
MASAEFREVRQIGSFDQSVCRLMMVLEDVFKWWTRKWQTNCGVRVMVKTNDPFSLTSEVKFVNVFIYPATWPEGSYIGCRIDRHLLAEWEPVNVLVFAPHLQGFTRAFQLTYHPVDPCCKLRSTGGNKPEMEQLWQKASGDYLAAVTLRKR